MPKLIQRRPPTDLDQTVKEVEKTALKPIERKKPLDYTKTVSTGSTLLDLAISGTKIRGGGIPPGIIVEIFGKESTGKTALANEIGGYIQARGGEALYADPEARLDKEYAEIYGLHLDEAKGDAYTRPDTVTELFDAIWDWETSGGKINVYIADSIAALSTRLELDNEEGDKWGMRRAKEFSEGLRKTCRKISDNSKLIVLTNQIRDSSSGEDSTGGHAIKFYSSLRLRTSHAYPEKYITHKKTIGKVEHTAKDGINVNVQVVKSSVDIPYREALVRIVFQYGIDDIGANLIYLKKMRGLKKYPAIDKEWDSLNGAIHYIEDKGFSPILKEQVIDMWEAIDRQLRIERKPKLRE